MKSRFFTIFFIFVSSILFSQTGLIRHYPLDGNANDIVGGFNGTINGGVTITSDETGTYGTAMSFNGSDGFIELPTTGLRLDSFTYSICLKPKFLPSSGQAYSAVSIGTSAADQYIFLARDVVGTQGWGSSSYYTPFVYPPYQISVGSLPTAGLWYNVVLTCSKSVEKLYVNGTLIDTISKSTTRPDYGSSSSMQARIGSRAGAPLGVQFFNGVIKDVQIFNRALTSSEIQNICNTSATNINESTNQACLPLVISSEENQNFYLLQNECNLGSFSLVIYNLLGEPVYQTNDPNFHWHTSSNIPSGQYFYKAEGIIDGEHFTVRKALFVQ